MKPLMMDWLIPSFLFLVFSLLFLPAFAARALAFSSGSLDASGGGDWEKMRESMVRSQFEARGIRDTRVLAAMRKVPRHLFVPESVRGLAYSDRPLPIGFDQTISQPYIVAFMTEALRPAPGSKVLEIGTGSGYQAAVLGELAGEVYSIEIVPELARRAQELLKALGYENVHVKDGDGYQGWPEHAPFDAIILTAAPPEIPQALLDQLKPGGRLVAPVGRENQDLVVVTKTEDGFLRESLLPVRFVPMVTKES